MKNYTYNAETFHKITNNIMRDELENADTYNIVLNKNNIIINNTWMSNINLPKGKILYNIFN